MLDGVADNTVNLGGGVELVDTVNLFQGAGGDRSGAGLLAYVGGGEGEAAAGAQAKDDVIDAEFREVDDDKKKS